MTTITTTHSSPSQFTPPPRPPFTTSHHHQLHHLTPQHHPPSPSNAISSATRSTCATDSPRRIRDAATPRSPQPTPTTGLRRRSPPPRLVEFPGGQIRPLELRRRERLLRHATDAARDHDTFRVDTFVSRTSTSDIRGDDLENGCPTYYGAPEIDLDLAGDAGGEPLEDA